METKTAVKKTTLENGIRILTKQMPHVRSVSMGVWVSVGARDESSKESGLSHFIEHMIFKGTKKRTGFQIAKEFDAIGGQTNAYTSMEHTCYHARVLDSHLAVMTDILSVSSHDARSASSLRSEKIHHALQHSAQGRHKSGLKYPSVIQITSKLSSLRI